MSEHISPSRLSPASDDSTTGRRVVAAEVLAGSPFDERVGESFVVEVVQKFTVAEVSREPQSVTNWEWFEGAVLAIETRGRDWRRVVGTAVMLAPGLAVTAGHVLNDELLAVQRGDLAMMCCGTRTGGLGD